jgi:hypothetical protein
MDGNAPSFVEVSFRGAVEAKQHKPPAARDRRNPVFLEAFRRLQWIVVQFDFKLHNYPQVSDKPVIRQLGRAWAYSSGSISALA